MSDLSFPCTSCGECCKHVGKWVAAARQLVANGTATAAVQEAANFPIAIQPDGSCSKLGEDNRCTIYDSRPLVCSITGVWGKYHSEHMTIEEYYKITAASCNNLVRSAKLGKKFIVHLNSTTHG